MLAKIDGSIFFTCTEVAKRCAVSRQTIWRWRQSGTIPVGRTSRKRTLVFTASELELIRAHASQSDGTRDPWGGVIYLDNSASARPLPIVRSAVARAMEMEFGNPSSAHGSGRRARQALAAAREQVAALAGADSSSVTFSSGGTEANNLILQGAVASGFRRIITTAVEHPSILETAEWLRSRGTIVDILAVAADGRISLGDLLGLPIDADTLVSIQWANNETGVLQPIMEAAAIVRDRGGTFHTDAAQAIGKHAIDFARSPIDAMTVTAHKIHGPQGVGALLLKPTVRPSPLLHGGSQERGLRVGTENYPGIIGFGVAAEHRLATLQDFVRHTSALRDTFETHLRDSLAGISINGLSAARVCTTGNATIASIDGQALIAQLDKRGVCMSQSSACANMRPEASHVLRAMGLTEGQAYASFRYAVSEDTTLEACQRAARILAEIAIGLGARSADPPAQHQRKGVN